MSSRSASDSTAKNPSGSKRHSIRPTRGAASIDRYFKLLAEFLAELLGRTDRDHSLYDPMIDQVKLIEKHIKTEGGKPPQTGKKTGNETMANVRRRYAGPEVNDDTEDPYRRTPRAT